MSKRKAPIGIFDSGVGGLTVLQEIQKTLPDYDYVYLGDSARAPYGTRSFDVVYEYTLQAVEKLFDLGCELVILACNTASAKALRTIQQNDLPRIAPDKRVLGVIRPTSEVKGKLSKSNHIGVFATEGTVRSKSYEIEIKKFFPETKVTQVSCPMWVPLIENGEINSEGSRVYIQKYIDEMFSEDNDIDAILLGCTHYPIIKSRINEHLKEGVQLLSQGEIVADSLSNYLMRHPEIEEKCSKNGEMQYYTTESSVVFSNKVKKVLNISIDPVKINI